ncbi:hypothetical protein OG474_38665 [Kribbella sp. NBC_01505]|uniref:hypothetical protein n=1 Tax=Kribbella sp. NBC_01505 TaxID=2903580 RepID=UPI003863DA87
MGNQATSRMNRRVVAGAAVVAVVLGSAVAATGTASAAKTRVNCDNNSSYMVTYSDGNSRCYAQNFLYVGKAKRVDLMLGAAGNYNVQIVLPGGGCTSLQTGIRGLKEKQFYAPGHTFAANIYVGTWEPASWSTGPGHLTVDC